MALLAGRDAALPDEERPHSADTSSRGGRWREAVQRVLGGALPIRPFRWLPVYLGAPFVTFLRKVIEMRYLWQTPLRLDDRRLASLLGRERHTALDEAVLASRSALREAASCSGMSLAAALPSGGTAPARIGDQDRKLELAT